MLLLFLSLNEGWGFCPTDANRQIVDPFTASCRSTKGGASAPPTPPQIAVANRIRASLNEGWGFCPTDAKTYTDTAERTPARSTKGGASAPPTRIDVRIQRPRPSSAQRRVGLLPHRRLLPGLAYHTQGWQRSTKGGASAPPTLVVMPGLLLLQSDAQRRVGLLPHRR